MARKRSRRKPRSEEPMVCVRPSELRAMLRYVGFSGERVDRMVRLLVFFGTLRRATHPEHGGQHDG